MTTALWKASWDFEIYEDVEKYLMSGAWNFCRTETYFIETS